MSHIVKIKLEVKNIKALKNAAKKLNLEFNEGVKQFNYYGSSRSACEHTISKKGDSHQMGVVASGKGSFELQWDPGYTSLTGIVGNKADKLKQEYAVAVATQEAEAAGMYVTRYDQKNGQVQLIAEYA